MYFSFLYDLFSGLDLCVEIIDQIPTASNVSTPLFGSRSLVIAVVVGVEN